MERSMAGDEKDGASTQIELEHVKEQALEVAKSCYQTGPMAGINYIVDMATLPDKVQRGEHTGEYRNRLNFKDACFDEIVPAMIKGAGGKESDVNAIEAAANPASPRTMSRR